MTLLQLMDLLEPTILTFMVVFLRVGFLIVFLPFWGDVSLPMMVRIALISGLALALTPAVTIDPTRFPDTFLALTLAVGAEMAFCFSIAFLLRLVFAGVMGAGQIMGEQMGFAFANMVSPDQSSEIPIVAQAQYGFAVMLYFAMNFHIPTLRALARSFELVAPFQPRPSDSILDLISLMATGMWETMVRMAAPVLATMLFVNVAMGLITKASPQINVLMESFPTRIMLGVFMFSIIVTGLAGFLDHYFSDLIRAITLMIQAWS